MQTSLAVLGTVSADQGEPKLLTVTFYGVRGSTPCPADGNRRYGGNTACVALEAPGADPVVLDLGTGLRYWGQTLAADGSFRGVALVTHIHWDHVQGLPFFVPVDRPGAVLDIYGPPPDEGLSLEQAFEEFMRPPFFPVRASDLRGDIRFHDVSDTELALCGAKAIVRPVPHIGNTNGYRVEMGGATVAYVSDHQMPMDGSDTIAPEVLELCDGVDLLIHDAQYTPDEFREKAHWGHCTIEYAIHVARESGARRLALFHHDPAHDDDTVDHLCQQAKVTARAEGVDEVFAAAEGMSVSFG